MSTQTELKLSRGAYAAAFVGDAILLGIAWLICSRHPQSAIGLWEAALVLAAGAAGATLAIAPFVLEYRAAAKMVETGALVSMLQQIQNLEEVALHINAATSQWQTVQENCARTTSAAKEISERITAEAAAFAEFLKKANESEKATLRLEVEKMRRAEAEWLQVVVRLLDHTYALNQAAARSGQAGLIEQLGQFQNACREVVRRIGLVPFQAPANEPFDPKNHQHADPQVAPPADAKVADTLAIGFTFQGRMLRPALVSLQQPDSVAVAVADPVAALEPEMEPASSKQPDGEPLQEEQSLL